MLKKVIGTKDFSIEFSIEDNKNIITFRSGVHDYGHAVVDRAFGNWFYKRAKANASNFELDDMHRFFLSLAIYSNDYSSYSDIHKDIYNVRLRHTNDAWNNLVATFRNEVQKGGA